jgi:hypothetical protein
MITTVAEAKEGLLTRHLYNVYKNNIAPRSLFCTMHSPKHEPLPQIQIGIRQTFTRKSV